MRRFLALFFLALLLCGCAGQTLCEEEYYAMNTVMHLKVWGKDAEAATSALKDLIWELDRRWSATSEDSLIGQLNRGEHPEMTDAEAALLQRADALSRRTAGAFDPHLRNLSEVWGFYQEENRQAGFSLPTDDEIMAALADPEWDMGALMKGYTGQEAAGLLAQFDIDQAILNLGGNIQTYGKKPDGTPWQVAVQNPTFAEDYVGILSVTGTASIVTSGDYQRNFEKNGVTYHHILDPETGYPADSGLSSVTIICRDGAAADALSTALFVMGLEDAISFWRESSDFEAVFITTEGKIYATEGASLSGTEYEVIQR